RTHHRLQPAEALPLLAGEVEPVQPDDDPKKAGPDLLHAADGSYFMARSTGSVASWNARAAGRMCIWLSRCWIAPFRIAARSLFSEKSVLKSRRLCLTLCHSPWRRRSRTRS